MPHSPRSPLRRLLLAALLALLSATPAMAASARVLLLLQAGTTAPWNVQITEGLRAALLRSHPDAELDVEVLPPWSALASADAAPAGWLGLKYRGRNYDVLVTPEAASRFCIEARDRLWPRAAVVVPTLGAQHARSLAHVPRLTGLAWPDIVSPSLALIFQLLPRTRHLALVSVGLDSDPVRPHWREALRPWASRADVIDLSGLDAETLLARVRQLPPDTALYFASPGMVFTGTVRLPRDLLQSLVAVSPVPVFIDATPQLGTGAVGGLLMSPAAVAQDIASQVDRLLDGTPAERIGFELHAPVRVQLDWRALQRWDIPLRRVPDDSDVQFQPPGLWEAYRGTVLITLATLLAQSALIAALVLERRRRRQAELRARHHLRELARLNRSGAIGALSAALAHEINQPLGAILSNAETAELLLDKTTPPRDELRTLLAAIRSDDQRAAAVLSRLRAWIADAPNTPQAVPLNALIGEVARMLRVEVRLREAELDLQLTEPLPDVLADGVQIQQVVLNLVLNALDAMQHLPPRERRVTVSTTATARGGAEVSVTDTGSGLLGVPPERLFEPFYTTKAQGLGVGLSISRSIVERHGGSLRVEEPAAGGAVFRFNLPATV